MSSFTVDSIMGINIGEKQRAMDVKSRITDLQSPTTNSSPYLSNRRLQDVVKLEPQDEVLLTDDEDEGLVENEREDAESPSRMSPSKDIKSPTKEDNRTAETFVAVIAQAILSSPAKRMTLSSIYNYIASNYSHFNQEKGPGWRNSVRHNLSSNDCFVKAVRAENGKGHYWMIHPKDLPEFTKGNFRRRRKPRRPRCHHSVMFNGSANENYFYHAFSTAAIPFSIPSTARQERGITGAERSPFTFGFVRDSQSKLPLNGQYDRPQYLDMTRNGFALPPSFLWPGEITARTLPKFTGAFNFHQLCACQPPGLQCYFHK